MIDRKLNIVQKIEEILATVTIANGYDFNLNVLTGEDWKMADQVDSGDLPLALVDSEGDESYLQSGNIMDQVSADIHIWVFIKKVDTSPRTEVRKVVKNIKKVLRPLVMGPDFWQDIAPGHGFKNFGLRRVRTDSGWSGSHYQVQMTYVANYVEDSEET